MKHRIFFKLRIITSTTIGQGPVSGEIPSLKWFCHGFFLLRFTDRILVTSL
ncbi:hypothetical protein PGB90_002966 [Kerria lacca]